MFLVSVLLVSVVVIINGQEAIPVRDYRVPYYYNYDETPKPYSFSYNAPLEDGVGHSARQEVADGTGKVTGSYTVTNDEGHTRVVDYVADEAGFRANIRTNEPGTDNQSPADVVMESSAPLQPYQYTPRRPAVITAVDPVATPVKPVEVVPENVVAPIQPGFYNLPNTSLYRNRNAAYRPHYRNRYYRNPYYGY